MLRGGITRREFLVSFFGLITGLLVIRFLERILKAGNAVAEMREVDTAIPQKTLKELNGERAYVYESRNGSPEQNLFKIMEMMGGIEKFISRDDIVVLKPNAQWWNQGMSNTNAMKGFIELVLGIPGFKGEIIIAENHHCYGPRYSSNIRGWTTQEKNGDFNYNELVEYFQSRGYKNVTKYHWVDAGPFSKDKTVKDKIARYVKESIKNILNIRRGKIVSGPQEGDGYVWSDIEYIYDGNKTLMSYPIFTSKYSGVTVDFKNGAWRNGAYTGQPVRFINFAGLNHHSKFAGVTSSIKNYLGIVDMTCGYPGAEPEGYVNFHTIGIPGMGGAVATFMKTIRKADLNIVTAEWVGFASRTDVNLAKRMKTIIVSTDPVALDYYGAKYLLFPLGGAVAHLNNPDNQGGPFRKFLDLCVKEGIGILNEGSIMVQRFDYEKS